MAKKSWSELTPLQRRFIVVGGAVEVALTMVAAVDLVGRPREAVRGPKVAWALALAIQPVGPIAYLVAGRR
jgi:hypothetical protein